MRLSLILLLLVACGGGQRGGGAKAAGYCGTYENVDPMIDAPVDAGFCKRTAQECQQVADDHMRNHQRKITCAPASAMHCWDYENTSYGDESCAATADACEESRAAAAPDPDREGIMGSIPPPGPCVAVTAP